MYSSLNHLPIALVAQDFKDKPVVVLGLNADSKVEDAKFVADAMSLNYATWRIPRRVVEVFKVQGFPSLLVIDPAGVVRDFDEGWLPTLRSDLGTKIQALLSAVPTAPPTATP